MYRAGGPKQVIWSKNYLRQIVGLLNNFVAETAWHPRRVLLAETNRLGLQVIEVVKFADSG
jgi:hypothetical protein